MHWCHIGANIYGPAGSILSKAPRAVQHKGRSSWSAHQKLADDADTGEAKLACNIT